MKILSVGHVTYDTTFETDYFPLENTKNRFHDKEEYIGGPASIAALLLAKWGLEVDIAGVVGNDDYGKKIKKEFTLNHVGVNYLASYDEASTSHSFVLANRSNGSRTIYCYTSSKVHLKPLQLDYDPDIILLDGYEYEASKMLLTNYPHAISVIDAGKDKKEVIELAKMVKYLVCSLEFAEKVTGIKADFTNKSTLGNIFTNMEAMFKNTIVITLEALGCMYRSTDQIKVMPSIKVKTVDSTAAGDIFHGAFVYGLSQKFDFEKTLKFANVAGALSVTRMGGYRSIPTLKEMNSIYEQVK